MNPVLKHLLIRLAIIFLVPGLFLFCLGLMLRGEENVDIGLGLIGLMGAYFVAAILFIFFETVHLFIKHKRVLSYCNVGILLFLIISTFLFLAYA